MAHLILIADGDLATPGQLEAGLRGQGFELVLAPHARQAMVLFQAQAFRAALVAQDLADGCGLSLLRQVRRQAGTGELPVLMLATEREEAFRIAALEAGADDCVAKPFCAREVVLRLLAMLRRLSSPAPSTQVGEIAFSAELHEVKVDGQRVALTAVEFKLLQTFAAKQEQVLTREDLLGAVWGREAAGVRARTVDGHLHSLREKLGPAARQLCTVRGFGYRLSAAAHEA